MQQSAKTDASLHLDAKNGLCGLLKYIFRDIWKGSCGREGRCLVWTKGSSGIRSDYVWCYQDCEPPWQSLHHGLNDVELACRRAYVSVSICVVNLSFYSKVRKESWKVWAVQEWCSCSIWWKLYNRCSVWAWHYNEHCRLTHTNLQLWGTVVIAAAVWLLPQLRLSGSEKINMHSTENIKMIRNDMR